MSTDMQIQRKAIVFMIIVACFIVIGATKHRIADYFETPITSTVTQIRKVCTGNRPCSYELKVKTEDEQIVSVYSSSSAIRVGQSIQILKKHKQVIFSLRGSDPNWSYKYVVFNENS